VELGASTAELVVLVADDFGRGNLMGVQAAAR